MNKPSLESMLKWMCLHGYFLRDDYEIRKDDPLLQGHEHGWSLFVIEKEEKLKKVAVFSGSYSWVVTRAFEESQKHKNENS